jgi:hypothetical protein
MRRQIPHCWIGAVPPQMCTRALEALHAAARPTQGCQIAMVHDTKNEVKIVLTRPELMEASTHYVRGFTPVRDSC